MKPNEITVPFVPMLSGVIDDLLAAAGLTDEDVVCDLGCGDGRVLVEAARRSRVRGIGLENDPELLQRAGRRAVEAEVKEKIALHEGDFEQEDTLRRIGIAGATVVVLYLLPDVVSRLLPRLFAILAPSTRIYSYAFHGDETSPPPDQRISTWSLGGLEHASYIYMWRVPNREGRDERGGGKGYAIS